MINQLSHPRFFIALAVCLFISSQVFSESNLEPPTNAFLNGEPVATMKSLNQVEPRTLIDSLPCYIGAPGSYYVSSPLFATNMTNGITISVGNVKVDLNGFPLIGRTNGVHGIYIMPGCFNVVIRNGVISEWTGFGIAGGSAPEMTITEVKVINNGWGGIYVGDNALIERCSVYNCGMETSPPNDDGINAGQYSTIIDSKTRHNHGANIHVYKHGRVTGCTATDSVVANGIWAEDYCLIRDCTVSANNKQGIRVGSRCRVVDNICGENGLSGGPTGYLAGIAVEGTNSVVQNNIVSGNNMGIRIIGPGNLIIHNAASKNIPCGDIVAWPPNMWNSNYVGKLTTFSGGNEFSTNSSWSNFSFQ